MNEFREFYSEYLTRIIVRRHAVVAVWEHLADKTQCAIRVDGVTKWLREDFATVRDWVLEKPERISDE